MRGVMNFIDAYHMMGDIWSMYKKYAACNLTDGEVAAFQEEAGRLYEKYKSAFAKDFVLAVVEEIGRTVDVLQKGEKNRVSREKIK